MNINNKKYLFDNPKNVKLLIRSLYVCCFVLFAMDLVIDRHIYHPWESFTGFYAIYGCLACVVLVMIAREMRKIVMRDEDYYDIKDTSIDNSEIIEEKKKEEKLMTGEKVDG